MRVGTMSGGQQAPAVPAQSVRPGIRQETLLDHGICHVSASDAYRQVGANQSGMLIPYRNLDGSLVTEGDKPYSRLRLDKPLAKQKYHQETGTSVHAFIPTGLVELYETSKCSGLCIVEGEFKAIALCESGFPAVGISGLYGFQNKSGELVDELGEVIEQLAPAVIYFCGDADTTLNWQFADAAVKLSALLPSVTVMLPRIPLAGGGKGVDDCKEELGDSFGNWWLERQREAIQVEEETGVQDLAVELFADQAKNLEAYLSVGGSKAQKALVKFLGSLEKGIALENAMSLASRHSGLALNALKAELRKEKNAKAGKTASTGSGDKKLPELYYFEGKYYRQNAQKVFTAIPGRDAERELKFHGFGHNKVHNEASEIDVALRTIQLENCVQGAGPLCGRMPGLVAENGFKYLVTRGPDIVPANGTGHSHEARPMFELLGAVFGEEVNPYYETQLLTFMAWLQRARLALKHPDQHLPGQMLVLVGPAGCGKSYLQVLITQMLGRRDSDPSLWLQGKTAFNGDLWTAEHLVMSDSNLEATGKGKEAMRDKIKEIVANPSYPCHYKGEEQLTLRPIWRLTLSANDDVTSANILPALENSTKDKLIYFKCYTKEGYFPDSHNREEHHEAILSAIPAFLHFVEQAEIPADMENNRWGVSAWHHPGCIELLQSYNPEQELEEILEKWLEDKSIGSVRKRPRELYLELDNLAGYSFSRCSRGIGHLGHQLARLMERAPWSEVITKTTERDGPTRCKHVYYCFNPAGLREVETVDDVNEFLESGGVEV